MNDFITIKLPVVHGEPKYGTWDETVERVCFLCGKGIKFAGPFGEPSETMPDRVILSNRFGTVHADCYPERLHEMETREAWATIAIEIARRPRAFTAAEVRAALTALARLALSTEVA